MLGSLSGCCYVTGQLITKLSSRHVSSYNPVIDKWFRLHDIPPSVDKSVDFNDFLFVVDALNNEEEGGKEEELV